MNKLEKYIQFILLKAVILSPDDTLVIWCSKKQSAFVHTVSDFARKHNICHTEIYYVESNTDNEQLKNKVETWKSNNCRMLWVYSDSCTVFPPLPWTTVNVASEVWAKQIFPEIYDTGLAVEKLWGAIFTACRIDDNDPIENWDRHIRNLDEKAVKLNNFNFEKLVFKNKLGTDFSVNLIKNHKWINCTAKNKYGETVITNIPTEEVFTAPDAVTANGVVYATRPLLYDDGIIDKYYIKFENGKVTEFCAEQNNHLLEKLLYSCKNADRIGEIAIVPHSSPISQLGLLWYDTSFDENTGCHIALGNAYPQCLQNYSSKEHSTFQSIGLNYSDIHEDIVIGSSDMEITGFTADGNAVIILKNGEWNI